MNKPTTKADRIKAITKAKADIDASIDALKADLMAELQTAIETFNLIREYDGSFKPDLSAFGGKKETSSTDGRGKGKKPGRVISSILKKNPKGLGLDEIAEKANGKLSKEAIADYIKEHSDKYPLANGKYTFVK